jgi:FkbM family methyltransferase
MKQLIKQILPETVKRRMRQLLWHQADLRYNLSSGIHIYLANEAEWFMYNGIFVEGEYDIPIRKALAKHEINELFTAVDLGANVGFFTLRLADLISREVPNTNYEVLLVEGCPTTYKELKSRLKSEVLLAGHSRLIHGLVGNRSGSGKIYELDDHDLSSLFRKTDGVKRDVNFVDLYDFVQNYSKIDLLKCDIEGSEELFIKNYNSLLSKVSVAVFEFHLEFCNKAVCTKIITSCGLLQNRVLKVDSWGGGSSVEMFWRD